MTVFLYRYRKCSDWQEYSRSRKSTSMRYRICTDNVSRVQSMHMQLDKVATSGWMLGYIRDQL